MENYSIDTQGLHAGYRPESGEATVPPIIQSTSFSYDSSEEVAQLFKLEAEGFFYSRLANPTVDVLEKKVATLEGGIGGVATASGQAAILIATLSIAQAGDHVLVCNNIYGGAFALFNNTLKGLGIEASFFSLSDTDEAIEALIKENTRLIFTETVSNPSLEVLDIERFAKIANKYTIPLVVDNTVATPVNVRPFEYGAHVVVHSATKYLDGHASSVGGVIVDSGNYDWNNSKMPTLTQPESNYGGAVMAEKFGELAYLVRARVIYLRDFGASLSPFNAWLINRGTETLGIRVERHQKNALEVAKFLESHPQVEWVNYPFLKSSDQYELAKKYLKGASGLVTFGVKGGLEESRKFIDSLELLSLVVNLADVRSTALHPATMTDSQLTPEEREATGISDNLVRLSIGIEHVEDIIADIKQALERV